MSLVQLSSFRWVRAVSGCSARSRWSVTSVQQETSSEVRPVRGWGEP